MRPVTPQEDPDANLHRTTPSWTSSAETLNPILAKLLARKAELIVERAAPWELDGRNTNPLMTTPVRFSTCRRTRRCRPRAPRRSCRVGGVSGPYFDSHRQRREHSIDRRRPPGAATRCGSSAVAAVLATAASPHTTRTSLPLTLINTIPAERPSVGRPSACRLGSSRYWPACSARSSITPRCTS